MKVKKLSLKLTLAGLTFLVGVGAVGAWYLARLEAQNRQSLPDIISSIPPVKIKVENPCDYPQPEWHDLEAEEAVYRAECFIIQNGYTDLPPLADESQITLEDIYTLTVEEGMAMRRDSLERRAFSYRRDNDFYGGSWVIMFRYKSHPNMMKSYGEGRNLMGRAVVMNFFGRHVRIQHSNYPLAMPDARIIKP